MTEIVNGQLKYNELTKNANGGTEQMARRMVRDIDPELFKGKQIIHSRVRDLEPSLKKILVVHDLANDPEVANLADPQYRSQFEKIVFVSHWQQHTYNMVLGVPFSQSIVIPNAIEPINYYKKSTDRPIKLIYHTTPHRGLNILVAAFQHLQDRFDIELDVYSSFKAYGWEERDKQFENLFEVIDKNPKIKNHGFKPNAEIRAALKESHIFAYPSIWSETSCISLIEALCAGNFCLHSNLGALPETSKGLSQIYMYNESIENHANKFTSELAKLIKTIEHDRNLSQRLSDNLSSIANTMFDWNQTVKVWENFLRNI